MQLTLDGAVRVLVEFTLSNAVPPVLLEDIFPSFTRYDGTSSSEFIFSTNNLTFHISPVQIAESEGSYSVSVRNPAGDSTATVYLDVQSKS